MGKKIEESLLKNVETDEEVDEKINRFPLPESIKNPIRASLEQLSAGMTKKEALGLLLANVILTALISLALFIIFMILIHLLGKLLDLVNRIPGFKQVNGFLGMVLALAEAVLVIDLFLLILVPLSGTSVGQYLDSYAWADEKSAWYFGPVNGSRLAHLEQNLAGALEACDEQDPDMALRKQFPRLFVQPCEAENLRLTNPEHTRRHKKSAASISLRERSGRFFFRLNYSVMKGRSPM